MNRDSQQLFLQSPDPEALMPSLNFHSFVSKNDCLPIDNPDPFLEDLLEYANRPPLQILVVSKPAVGRTAFSALLARKLDIIHVEPLSSLQRKDSK